MISAEQAVNILKGRLDEIERIDDYVLRGVKRYKNRPYAVFYIDISNNVEERAKQLTQFQDRVLGRRFFNEGDDLRWNSYLLFLADKNHFSRQSFARARSIVEADRNYARKFVIPEDELAASLDSRLPAQGVSQLPTSDVLHLWETLLTGVGLQGILDDYDIATIARKVINGSADTRMPATTPQEHPQDNVIASNFLQRIEIVKFRDYPTMKSFMLGTVNLIRGVNGVGKTTLLEAIEYFYCGSNRRCDPPSGARIIGTLRDHPGGIETSAALTTQRFRDRHLHWYGKLDLKRNLMPDSFANFNFLNTDAAVHLSTDSDPKQLDSNLATLLVGAEASRVWDRIKRVQRELKPYIRSLEDQVQAASSKIKTNEDRLATAKNVVRKSDELFTLLKGHLTRIKWHQIPNNKEIAASDAHTKVVDVESALKSASTMSDLPPNLTLETLTATLRLNTGFLDRASALSKDFSAVLSKKQQIGTAYKERAFISDQLRELEKYLSAGFLELMLDLESRQTNIIRLTAEIGGLQIEQFSSDQVASSTLSVHELQLQFAEREKEFQEAAQTAKKLFDALSETHDHATLLSQQLRTIAQQILEGGADNNVCPLCHTTFSPGELQRHILAEVDVAHELRNQEARKTLEAAQQKYVTAQSVAKQLSALVQFCRRSKLDERSVTAKNALMVLEQATGNLVKAQEEIASTQARLIALQASGLSTERATQLRSTLYPKFINHMTKESVDNALVLNEQELSQLTAEITRVDSHLKELNDSLIKLVEDTALFIQADIKQVINALQKRTSNLSLASESIRNLQTTLHIDDKSALEDILSALREATSIQQQLRQAISLEATADKSMIEAAEALSKAVQDEAKVKDSLKRVQNALAILNEISEKHSLETASRTLLEENRSQVARIFSRIHSPHEFEVNIEDDAYLKRITTKKLTRLNEISTGQRAAFALSVFLAMNAYATKAPPVILIDDPVAHVDDLNTLSFLDYLRDLASTATRQIFFSTADDKLAGLFEHKFSFLGEDFQQYNLTRD